MGPGLQESCRVHRKRTAKSKTTDSKSDQERKVMFTTVTKQLKRALGAAKSVLALAGTAAAVLDPKLQTYLREGEQLDGLKPIQLTLVRWIEDDHQHLEEQEAGQRAAMRQLKQLRLERDDRQQTLYSKLLRIRKTFDDAFGQGMAAVYLGLAPRMGEVDPMTFQRQAKETVAVLSDPEFVSPAPEVEGIWENPAKYADQIQLALAPFQGALDEIASQKREVEKARKAKTELLEEIGERLTWSIRLFEALYQLAGLGYHAERLRVNVASRPSSGEEAGDSDDGAAPDVDGEEPVEAPGPSPSTPPSQP